MYFTLLVIAGNETTRHAISNSMLGLMEQRDQLAAAAGRPVADPGSIEELLRWASPVYHFRRTATRDIELGGKEIKEGDKVVMWFASGNRDDAQFDDPYSIDVTRAQRRPHDLRQGQPAPVPGQQPGPDGDPADVRGARCPGSPDIELAGDVRRVRSNFVNGIKAFPVKVTPRLTAPLTMDAGERALPTARAPGRCRFATSHGERQRRPGLVGDQAVHDPAYGGGGGVGGHADLGPRAVLVDDALHGLQGLADPAVVPARRSARGCRWPPRRWRSSDSPATRAGWWCRRSGSAHG